MLAQAKEDIISGKKSWKEVKNASIKYVGNGSYVHIGVHITPFGRQAGWIYKYPCLKFNGKMYLDAGKTIKDGLIDGHLELDHRTTTVC